MNSQRDSSSPLYLLPRELRDKIYSFYFFQEAGYLYDYGFKKLRLRDSQPNQLALMYTCKAINQETKGFAFKVNTLIFTTYLCPEDLVNDARSEADSYCSLFKYWLTFRSQALCHAIPCITTEIMQRLAELHPNHLFLDLIQEVRDGVLNPESLARNSVLGAPR